MRVYIVIKDELIIDVYRFAQHIERDINISARSISRHLRSPGDIYRKKPYKIIMLNVKMVRASDI